MELRDRVALVTGAGRRVGRVLATTLAGRGVAVAVHYHRSEAGAREVIAEITSAGGRADAVPGDLSAPGTPAAVVARTLERFDRLDILVNSAAIMERTAFGEVRVEEWNRILDLNLRAPFFLAQSAAPALRQAKGAIVNVADLSAFETWPGYAAHSISKSGLVHMTRLLARILAPDVRVNAIAPGTVLLPDDWTEADRDRLNASTPLRREGTPEDVAQALLYLLEAEYVTGETIIVDGGRHVRVTGDHA